MEPIAFFLTPKRRVTLTKNGTSKISEPQHKNGTPIGGMTDYKNCILVLSLRLVSGSSGPAEHL
jgi:hypothetical protein